MCDTSETVSAFFVILEDPRRQCDNYNPKSNRRCNNIVSYEFLSMRRKCDTNTDATACCLVVGLGLGFGLGLDSVSGWQIVMHTYSCDFRL